MEYFRCGKILTTHGLKGDLKIQILSDFDRFSIGKRLYIKHKDEYVPVIIDKSSNFGKNLLVRFKDLEDINLVEKYHSDELYVSSEDRKDELAIDEYYYTDLLGLEVINQDGKSRGFVKEIKELPQCDYLYVENQGKFSYIPFLEEFIIEVNDKIIINEIEGLINED